MNSNLRIIFMGTPEFAVASLSAIVEEGYNVVAVITAPDKPAGRGQKLQMSAVKTFAQSKNIKVLQPTNLKDEGFVNELKDLKADLQIVVAFRMLPEIVWNMPPLGTFNLHGSLLPKYRGAAPINWCIMNGDTETGVTTFKLTHEIDTGNILFRESIKIGDKMNAGELHDLMMQVGAKLIVRTVKAIDASRAGTALEFEKQDDSKATHAPKIFKDTCKIDWNKPIKSIFDKIRGLSPYPTAYTEFVDASGQKQTIKIFKATQLSNQVNASSGKVSSDNRTFVNVHCKDGILQLEELQLQGKKRMTVKEFLNGYKFTDNTQFE